MTQAVGSRSAFSPSLAHRLKHPQEGKHNVGASEHMKKTVVTPQVIPKITCAKRKQEKNQQWWAVGGLFCGHVGANCDW